MNRLKELRLAAGISRRKLALEARVAEGTLRGWERETRSISDRAAAARLAALLHCDVEELCGAAAPPPPRKKGAIQTCREAAGLSQAELARRLGVNFRKVSDWERGEYTPLEEHYLAMAGLLGCTPEALGYVPRRRPLSVRESVEVRNQLVLEHLRLIPYVMSWNKPLIRATCTDYEDLYQSMALKLCQAAETYDPDKGDFRRHAIEALKWELLRQTALSSARGIKDAPRDFYPVFLCFEELQYAI